MGCASLDAQEQPPVAGASILPHYPTSKRQIVPSASLNTNTVAQNSELQWGARKPQRSALPQRSTAIGTRDVVPASMNLRVGAQEPSSVTPAVVLLPAETIVANSNSEVEPAQARSRFQPAPALDPPSGFPTTGAPDVIDGDPSFSAEADEAPLATEPPVELPPVDEPETADPAPSELPPLTDPSLPDHGAARGFDVDEKEQKKPCRENYRDTNCCEQNSDCRDAWDKLERNPVRLFPKAMLDITPLYRPDVRYAGTEEIDQEKSRSLGLAIDALRVWKNAKGETLGLDEEGNVLGLDGADWVAQWEQAAREADEDIGSVRPPRPADFKGRAKDYRPGASQVTVVDESGRDHSFNLSELSIDDNEWLNGRDWRDAQGRILTRGRFYDYEWNRILVRSADGRITPIPFGVLGDMDLCYVGAYWGEGVGLPAECRLRGTQTIRNFTMTTYTWKASGLCHKPLYFEEVQLERYGHTFGPVAQPIVSGAHFFANIAILPYKMSLHPCHECQYALGYYRPGDCAPYMIPPVPLSVRAGLNQAAAVTGAVALFP